MATKWNELQHKASPELRARVKDEALAEHDRIEEQVETFPDDEAELDGSMQGL